MGFHSRLNSRDLHAPSRLPIRNDSPATPIRRGDPVFISGYVSADGVYSAAPVAPDYLTAGTTTDIIGIADEDVINVGSTGSIVTFGVVESISIPSGVTSTDRGRPLYLVLGATGLGTLTVNQGADPGTIAIGTILGAANNVADVFMFSLEAGFIRDNYSSSTFKGIYAPANAADLPNVNAPAGSNLAVGDYFIAIADTTSTPFPTITRGDIFIVTSTPDTNNSPVAANDSRWVAGNFAQNNAVGGGTGTSFSITVDGGTPLTTTANFETETSDAEYGIDFTRDGATNNISAALSTALENKLDRVPDPTMLPTAEYILNVDNTQSTPQTVYTWRTLSTANAEGRLECTVVNNTGAILTAGRAYSLEDDVYNQATNTVTLTATLPGTVTAGQTGLVWLETEIAATAGTSGAGILKGIVSTGTPGTIVELEVSILAGGTINSLPLDSEYIIGTTLKSTLPATNIEFAFDGLSNYQLRREGRLECNIQNNSTSTLTALRAYSLDDDVYSPALNLVTFNDVKNGSVVDGQTGLVWIETAILAGASGKGVLRGIVNSSASGSANSAEQDLKINTSGMAVTATDDTYVIATSLRSPSTGTIVEYSFDGLSTSKLSPIDIPSAPTKQGNTARYELQTGQLPFLPAVITIEFNSTTGTGAFIDINAGAQNLGDLIVNSGTDTATTLRLFGGAEVSGSFFEQLNSTTLRMTNNAGLPGSAASFSTMLTALRDAYNSIPSTGVKDTLDVGNFRIQRNYIASHSSLVASDLVFTRLTNGPRLPAETWVEVANGSWLPAGTASVPDVLNTSNGATSGGTETATIWGLAPATTVSDLTSSAPITLSGPLGTPNIAITAASSTTSGSMAAADKVIVDASPVAWDMTRDVSTLLVVDDQRVFGRRLYVNLTGDSAGDGTAAQNQNPATDTINWREAGTAAIGIPDAPSNLSTTAKYELQTGITGIPATSATITVNFNSVGTSDFAFIDIERVASAGGAGTGLSDLIINGAGGTADAEILRFFGGGGTAQDNFLFQVGNHLRMSNASFAPATGATPAQMAQAIADIYSTIPTPGSFRTVGNFQIARNYNAEAVGDSVVFTRITTGAFSPAEIWEIEEQMNWTTTPTIANANGVNATLAVPNVWTAATGSGGGTGTVRTYSNASVTSTTNTVGLPSGSTSTNLVDLPFKQIRGDANITVTDSSVSGDNAIEIESPQIETNKAGITGLNTQVGILNTAVLQLPQPWSEDTAASGYSSGTEVTFSRKIYRARRSVTFPSTVPRALIPRPNVDPYNWQGLEAIGIWDTNRGVNPGTGVPATPVYVASDQVFHNDRLYTYISTDGGNDEPGTTLGAADWALLGSGGGTPAAFVKSTSINGTTSVSFVDQDDVTTTFTPAGGSTPAAFVKSATVATDNNSVTFVDQGDNSTEFTRHIVENSTGTDFIARTNLQFVGATVSDDSTNNRTIVTITSGSEVRTTSFSNRDIDFRSSLNAKLGSTLPFNTDNAGFIWEVDRSVAITEINGAPVNVPIIPPPAVMASEFTAISATIDGTAAAVTFGLSGTNNSILTFTHSTQITNTNVALGTNFPLVVNFTYDGTVYTLNTTLQYSSHPNPSASLSATPVNFQDNITVVNVTGRSPGLSAGSVAANSTNFPVTVMQTAGSILFNSGFSINKDTLTATDRSMREVLLFTTAAGGATATASYDTPLSLNGLFQFPAYLGSITTAQRTALDSGDIASNRTLINGFTTQGTFTSDPLPPASSNNALGFNFPDGGSSGTVKIFAIARRFTSGETLRFKASANSMFAIQMAPITQITVGTGNTETYDVYQAQDMQSGAIQIFVETL